MTKSDGNSAGFGGSSQATANTAFWTQTFPVGVLGCNCSIVADLNAKSAIVIDPGGDFPKIESKLSEKGLSVSHIVHTHTHIDHVGATAKLQKATGAEAAIHEADRILYDMLGVQAAMLGMKEPERVAMEGNLHDGGCISCGSFELWVLHTPGHTPGSLCFMVNVGAEAHLFSGDTLFRRGIGRTDLWGGDSGLILRSIKERLFTLAPETHVVPGHGPRSTIGEEVRENPFAGAGARVGR
jgi:hydroxyacylglutathione hydrolase